MSPGRCGLVGFVDGLALIEPRWWAQRFPPEGGAASDGIRRQLGTPSLDPLTVLVREMAQNSWDARVSESSPVRFSIAIDTLDGGQLRDWRQCLSNGVESVSFDLDSILSSESVLLVTVSDRGTTGLGGPIRSGVDSAESPDFVNFVRNVGERRDREFGGGTYGFGKGSLYQISGSHTVLVNTRCHVDGGTQRRLMGTALGHSFSQNGAKYTGRHWWGLVNDNVPDPLLDGDALDIAGRLGLPMFTGTDTGTDLVIVGAKLGALTEDSLRAPHDAAEHVASALAWYLWPKLIDRGAGVPLQCSVSVDGEAIEVPDPERDPRIAPFVAALRKLDLGEAKRFERRRPPFVAGYFASEVTIAPLRAAPVTDLAAPFEGPSHHCARMRHVELVVDYLAGPELPDSIAQYAAVFKAHREADEYFAEAEPPTHDAWITRHLQATALGVVRDATSFVRARMQELLPSSSSGGQANDGVPLGGLSQRLSKAIPGGPGNAGSGSGERSGGGRGSRRVFRVVSGPRLTIIDGVPRVVADVQLKPSAERLTIQADAFVATDSGREASPPVGAAFPTVLGWVGEDGARTSGEKLVVDAGSVRRWTVVVAPGDETATRVEIRAIDSDGGTR